MDSDELRRVGAGEFDGARVGARHDRLPTRLHDVKKTFTALRVEFAQDIVEDKDRHRLRLTQVVALRKEQRENREALLALAAKPTKISPFRLDEDVVAMGAREGLGGLNVTVAPGGGLLSENGLEVVVACVRER